MSQELLPLPCAQLAQPAGIDRIGLVLPDGVLQGAEPARHQRIDHRHRITGFAQSGAPVQMQDAGRFQHDQHLLRRGHLCFEPGQQLAQAAGARRQIFLEEAALFRGAAQSGADFVFGDIYSKDISWFH